MTRLLNFRTRVGPWRIYTRAAPRAGGRPVVLVHGFGVSSRYFIPTAQRLSDHFSVYVPDLPGHGRSSTPRTPLDVPGLAGALVAWMDAVGIKCASLVGNSMGCQIAVEVALRHPERVNRLVLIGPSVDPAGRNTLEQFRRLVLSAPYERFSLSGILLLDYARMAWRIVPELRAMLRYRTEEVLPRIAQPVLLVRGEHDAVAPPRWLTEAARLLETSRTLTIPGGGHAVNHSMADVLVPAILPFLTEA